MSLEWNEHRTPAGEFWGWIARSSRCVLTISDSCDDEEMFPLWLCATLDQGREAPVGAFESVEIAKAAAEGVVGILEQLPVAVGEGEFSRKRLNDALRTVNDEGVPDSPFACCRNCAGAQVRKDAGEDATAAFFCDQVDEGCFDDFGVLGDDGIWLAWMGDVDRLCSGLVDAGFRVEIPEDESVAIHVLPGGGDNG